MSYFLTSTFNEFACFVAKEMDSDSLKGMIKPLTFSLPIEETANAKVVAESIPPDRPKTTPLAPASFTRVLINF